MLKDGVRHTVWGIALLALCVFLVISAWELAGPVGGYVYKGLSYLFGNGYYLLPIATLLLSMSFFRSTMPKIVSTRMFGIFLFHYPKPCFYASHTITLFSCSTWVFQIVLRESFRFFLSMARTYLGRHSCGIQRYCALPFLYVTAISLMFSASSNLRTTDLGVAVLPRFFHGILCNAPEATHSFLFRKR